MANGEKLALIGGAGGLPLEIADFCQNKNLYIIGIEGVSDDKLLEKAHGKIGIGEIGKAIKLLKTAQINAVAIAGYVKRPDFAKVAFDATGLMLLPKILGAAKQGDDAIMRVILSEFEKNGIKIIGPEILMEDLLEPMGVLTTAQPDESDIEDIKKAAQIITAIGEFDIGQACVINKGIVLTIEAQEGTNAMLERINSLPKHLCGNQESRAGVLYKAPKPIQEMRIDLPTIGINTIEIAAQAGLKGIAFAAGRTLLAQKAQTIELANNFGMFIISYDENFK